MEKETNKIYKEKNLNKSNKFVLKRLRRVAVPVALAAALITTAKHGEDIKNVINAIGFISVSDEIDENNEPIYDGDKVGAIEGSFIGSTLDEVDEAIKNLGTEDEIKETEQSLIFNPEDFINSIINK